MQSHRRHTMWLGAYVRSHAALFVSAGALEVLLASIMDATEMNQDMTTLFCLVVAVAFLIGLLADYARHRSFYRSLDEVIATGEAPLLFANLLETPAYVEGRLTYEIAQAMARAANDTVAQHHRQTQEYRDYVETWAHEAKSPLAAAHLALENVAPDLSAVARDPRRLRTLDDKLMQIESYVDQALFYARSESVDRDYLVRPCALLSAIQAAVRAHAYFLIAQHVTPCFGEGLDLEVFTDTKWFEFMLGQLVQNSARYANVQAPGGSRIWFSAQVMHVGLSDECVELTVRDNGQGVSSADLARVFDRGFTGSLGRKHKKSTGLGMWLVARLAHKMGLTVSAFSQQGQGFSVIFRFPTNKMHYMEL